MAWSTEKLSILLVWLDKSCWASSGHYLGCRPAISSQWGSAVRMWTSVGTDETFRVNGLRSPYFCVNKAACRKLIAWPRLYSHRQPGGCPDWDRLCSNPHLARADSSPARQVEEPVFQQHSYSTIYCTKHHIVFTRDPKRDPIVYHRNMKCAW